jgi:DNA mismatch repair enzyme (predicted ATPase)
MGKIIILDENTSNKIAAGEVVEKPSSVVKELVENSLDAGASAITIEIKNGGITYIKVMDNGSGMEEDDVGIAFERHSTSKIRSADDIESISSMGFRGGFGKYCSSLCRTIGYKDESQGKWYLN